MACPPHPVPRTTILSFFVAVAARGSSPGLRGRFITAAGLNMRLACMKASSAVSIARSANARMSSVLNYSKRTPIRNTFGMVTRIQQNKTAGEVKMCRN